MTPTIELWDLTTSNLLGDFPDEPAAIETLSELAAAHGGDYAGSVAVIRRSEDGQGEPVGTGTDLLRRHNHALPAFAD